MTIVRVKRGSLAARAEVKRATPATQRQDRDLLTQANILSKASPESMAKSAVERASWKLTERAQAKVDRAEDKRNAASRRG